MQHYKSASLQMLRHQYDTPTFKTNALRLDSNEGQLKHLLLWYKRLILVLFGCNWRLISSHTTHPLLKLKRFVLLALKGG